MQVGSCTLPVFLTADTVVLPSLASGNRTPTIVPFTFRARVHELPISLGASVIATYTTPTGEPRCAGYANVLSHGWRAQSEFWVEPRVLIVASGARWFSLLL